MLYIDYRIAAAYTRGQEDSRSNMLSQEALLPWEQAVSRYVPFLPPQWLPIGGNTAADSFSRLNLELCLFWGLFVQQGPYFVGLFSTNNTKGGFFLLWEQTVSGYVFLHSSRLPFKAQFGSVDILAGQEDVQAHFWILFNFNHVMPVLEVILEVMAHIM